MEKTRIVQGLVLVVLTMITGQGFGVIEYNDGGTHNIDYSIYEKVHVGNGVSGEPTTVNVLNGGNISAPPAALSVSQNSKINISGGSVGSFSANDNSKVTMSSGSVEYYYFAAAGNAQIIMSGGTVGGNLQAWGNGQIILSGGAVMGNLSAYDSSHITICGSNFEIDGSPVDFGEYFSTDFIGGSGVLTCTLDSGALLNNSFYISTNASIFLVPEPASLLLHYPNGSEILQSGDFYTIEWDSTGIIENVLIEYSTDSGNSWFPVEPANVGNSGSYEWFVPFANSNECLVRISDISNLALYDTSDDVFTISQENPSEYPTLYEIMGGSAPAITESGRDFVTRSILDANMVAFILIESAGYANENLFGIYSAYDPQEKLQLFSGIDGPSDMVIVQFDSAGGTAENLQTGQTAAIEDFFGFFLTTPQNGGTTFYTDATINPDSSEHGLIFNTSGFSGFIDGDPDAVVAFEDLLGLGDQDYNDMVVGITNVSVMPGSEPYCIRDIPGDVNHDCKVNLVDFAEIAAYWLGCNLDPQEACFGE